MAQGFINKSFIDQLKEQANIVDLVGRYVRLKKAGSGYQGLCPFHDEKTPSFHVNPQKNFFHCFGCGASGDTLAFLMRQDSLEFSDAVHRLADMTGMKVVYDKQTNTTSTVSVDTEAFAVLQQASDFYSQQLKSAEGARHYLKQRGIDDELVKDYGLGYAPAGNGLFRHLAAGGKKEVIAAMLRVGLIKEDSAAKRHYDFFRERLIFPIVDLRNRVLGFGGRTLGADEPKYINSADSRIFHKGKEFYGASQALGRKNKTGHLLVVEGYMDVLALAGVGESVLACLGTALTDDHIRKLLRWTDKLVFAFDGDKAGQEAAKRAAVRCLPWIEDGKEIGFVFLPSGEDPQSLIQSSGLQAWQELERVSLSEFLLGDLKMAKGAEEKAGRMNELGQHLSLLPKGAFRNSLQAKVEEMTGMKIRILSRPTPSMAGSEQPPKQEAKPRFDPSSQTVSIMEKFLSYLVAQPQLASQLDPVWYDLVAEYQDGDLGQVNRFLKAAEKGIGYLYGYIQGCGQLYSLEDSMDASLGSLQDCVYRLLRARAKADYGLAIREQNREKSNQAREKLAWLAKLRR